MRAEVPGRHLLLRHPEAGPALKARGTDGRADEVDPG
jgi:hypothetical protein